MLEQLLDRARVDDLPAVLAGPRTDVDDPVGRHDRLLVVLDDDQGVAQVLEPDQGLDQALVVALVEADAGLVEHVENTDQARADLGGQPDALGLTTGESGGRPRQREVVEADVEEEPEPLLDLLEHPLGDLAFAVGELELVEELGRLVDRQRADLGDVASARALLPQRDRDRDRLEPGALARRARHLAHEPLVAVPAGVGLGLAVAPLDVGADPLEVGVVGAFAAVAVDVAHVHLGRVSLEDGLAALGRQVLPRGVQVEPELVTERAQQPGEVVADVGTRPGSDHALAEGGAGVGDDQLRVDLHPGADAVALGAGAEG